MKVLLINKFYYIKGGSERVFFNTKELLEKNGHQVICFSMKDSRNLPSSYEKYFVPYVDFQNKKKWLRKVLRFIYFKKSAKSLAQLIAQEKPDIAHLHNISHQITPAILKPLKKLNIPVVQTLHDYQIICPNYRLFNKDKVCEKCFQHKYYKCTINKCVQEQCLPSLLSSLELYHQWVGKYYKEKVDLFISPSKFLKDKVLDWGLERPIEVLPNFLKVANFEPDYNNDNYILFVGRLSQEKGLLSLLSAMKELPNINLKVVGDGPEKIKVQRYISINKLNNVDYLGAQYGEDLVSLIKKSKFVVVPSTWYENYPILVIEAMALGKPVLASRLGGLVEMVKENETGWFFEAGNSQDLQMKIKQNYNSENLKLLGKNARAQVEKMNCANKHYVELIKIYNRLVNKSNSLNLG